MQLSGLKISEKCSLPFPESLQSKSLPASTLLLLCVSLAACNPSILGRKANKGASQIQGQSVKVNGTLPQTEKQKIKEGGILQCEAFGVSFQHHKTNK